MHNMNYNQAMEGDLLPMSWTEGQKNNVWVRVKGQNHLRKEALGLDTTSRCKTRTSHQLKHTPHRVDGNNKSNFLSESGKENLSISYKGSFSNSGRTTVYQDPMEPHERHPLKSLKE